MEWQWSFMGLVCCAGRIIDLRAVCHLNVIAENPFDRMFLAKFCEPVNTGSECRPVSHIQSARVKRIACE